MRYCPGLTAGVRSNVLGARRRESAPAADDLMSSWAKRDKVEPYRSDAITDTRFGSVADLADANMSVRRLAEASVQPASLPYRGKRGWAEDFIQHYPKGREQSAIIPLMMRAQEQEGWVTKAAIERIADMLGMPYIRALEVATFYTQYQLKPVGTKAHVQVCGTTPCMLRGAEALMDVCRSKIHHDQFHANETGTLSWEEVECLGACVNAPMVMIFKDTFEDLTPERLGEIIDLFDEGRGDTVTPGPQNGRIYSGPITGLTSLLDEKAVLKSTRDREAKAAKAAAPVAAPDGRRAVERGQAEDRRRRDEPGDQVTVARQGRTRRPKRRPARKRPGFPAPRPTSRRRPWKMSRSSAPRAAARSTPRTRESRSSMFPPVSLVRSARSRSPRSTTRTGRRRCERPAEVDDLRLISGVGPKIEGILNSLGIFTYAQVASWTKAERDWVDGYLNFKGRIDRDDWVRQAEALAKGGVTEYVRVFGRSRSDGIVLASSIAAPNEKVSHAR